MSFQDQGNRQYAAAHFSLAIDGIDKVGNCKSIEGGNIKADVMTYQSGSINDHWRQLGKPHFEDLKLTVGMSMSKTFYQWIGDFFAGLQERKNGAIVAADFHYKERARRHFTNALVKELVFPKLDGSDKNAAYLNVTLAVEGMVFLPGDPDKLREERDVFKEKEWKACNFHFGLDGYEDACHRVTKIDSFTVKMNVLEYHAGGHRAPLKMPSQVDFPQITFYVPEADALPFYKHVQKRIINDSAEQPGRLTGFIQTYDNANTAMFLLQFSGAEIVAVTPDKSDATTEEIKLVKVELCVETMNFLTEDPYALE